MSRPVVLLSLAILASPLSTQSQSSRQRDTHEWAVKAEKMREHLLPTMRKHGVDLWIIMSRENNTDPALDLFGAYGISGWYGHRNAYLFYDAGAAGLKTTVIGTHLSSHLGLFYDEIQDF